jgi:drug/metabolite transporter (DMT)-like permease
MKDIKRLYTLIFCFAAVYIVWGSTYLAIRVAIDSIPPWTLTGTRYLLSGSLLFLLSSLRKEAKLTSLERKIAVISGLFMMTANGVVCVAELYVPSGIAALLIGAMPIWMMLVSWIGFRSARPELLKFFGAGIGLFGVGIIAADNFTFSSGSSGALGIGLLILSSVSWAIGTLIQRGVLGPGKLFRFTAVQNFWGAMLPMGLSLLFEKPWELTLESLSANSIMAHLYLVVFGSILAFTAYSWLARNVESHILSTYALVNPIIAIILGSLVLGEALDSRLIWSTLFVLTGLALLLKKPKAKNS